MAMYRWFGVLFLLQGMIYEAVSWYYKGRDMRTRMKPEVAGQPSAY